MSKRDTIIIALLVNASLLALLFMLAVNTEEDGVFEHSDAAIAFTAGGKSQKLDKSQSKSSEINTGSTKNGPIKNGPMTVVLTDSHVNDEVDSFLKDLAAEDRSEQPTIAVDDDGYIQLSKEPSLPIQSTKKDMAQSSQTVSQNNQNANQSIVEDYQNSGDQHYVDVTVKRGDALEKIARSNGTSVEAIKKANHLSSAKLSVGQVLRIPTKKSLETADAASQKTRPAQPQVAALPPKEVEKKINPSTDAVYYTIKSGDSPWKIAKQHNVPFEDLLKLNNLDEERARTLKIGDRIRVK